MLLRLFGGILVLMVLLVGTAGTKKAFADVGKPLFSIEPALFSPYSSSTRGYFTYTSSPFTQLQDKVLVINTGSARGTLHLHGVDATTGQGSGTIFLPFNASKHDVGAWIKFSQQDVTLSPGQSLSVSFTLTIPAHVRPGQHCGGITGEVIDQQQIQTSARSTSINISIHSVLGLGVLVNIPGPTVEKLNATNIRYDVESTYERLLVSLQNTGTQILHPAGDLRIIDSNGHQVQNLPLKLNSVLPQTAINYPVYIQHQPLVVGKSYTAKLHLGYEGNHALDYTTAFQVPLSLSKVIPQVIPSFVTANSVDLFSLLTPWRCAAGMAVLLLLLSGLFFWSQQVRKRGGSSRSLRREAKPNV